MTYKVWAAAMGVFLLAAGSASAGEGDRRRLDALERHLEDPHRQVRRGPVRHGRLGEVAAQGHLQSDAAKRDRPITGRRVHHSA